MASRVLRSAGSAKDTSSDHSKRQSGSLPHRSPSTPSDSVSRVSCRVEDDLADFNSLHITEDKSVTRTEIRDCSVNNNQASGRRYRPFTPPRSPTETRRRSKDYAPETSPLPGVIVDSPSPTLYTTPRGRDNKVHNTRTLFTPVSPPQCSTREITSPLCHITSDLRTERGKDADTLDDISVLSLSPLKKEDKNCTSFEFSDTASTASVDSTDKCLSNDDTNPLKEHKDLNKEVKELKSYISQLEQIMDKSPEAVKAFFLKQKKQKLALRLRTKKLEEELAQYKEEYGRLEEERDNLLAQV